MCPGYVIKALTNKLPLYILNVLYLIINSVIALSKWPWNREPQASGSAVNFDNVLTKLIFKKRTDVNLSFTVTRSQRCQMPGINEGKRLCKHAVDKAK